MRMSVRMFMHMSMHLFRNVDQLGQIGRAHQHQGECGVQRLDFRHLHRCVYRQEHTTDMCIDTCMGMCAWTLQADICADMCADICPEPHADGD